MKVILLADVKKVGKKDQTIEVSDGYATNYLFPHHLAVQVTKRSVEVLQDQQETARQLEAEKRAKAQDLAEKLKGITVEFKVKTGKEGKLFGNISTKQIEDELNKQFSIQIDKKKFIDKGPINSLGYHSLKIELHKGVIGVIKVHLVSEGEN